MPNLKGRSLLTLIDYTPEEIRYLLKLSHKVKKQKNKSRFKGKSIALLFEKRSTRTRCAFETAFGEEAGHPVFLSSDDIQLGSKESVEDTARVLGRMFDCIEFRGFKQKNVEILAKESGVPVYNGLTDIYHPTQALADIMTFEEEFGTVKNKKLCYIGDGRNNVANSLMIICSKLGLNYTVISPKDLLPDSKLVKEAKIFADKSESQIILSTDINDVKNSDVVYTDVWISMGEESKSTERLNLLKPYQITEDIMKKTNNPKSIFLHCLPAVKGNEVSYDVIEGIQSRVFDQAENRKHTIKALMLATL